MNLSESRKRGLGRGLSALFEEAEADYGDVVGGEEPRATTGRKMAIDLIIPGPYQPRQRFDEEAIGQLAASIRTHGLIQPILVRPSVAHPGRFEIIAGERRWRAAQQAGLHDVPIIERQLDDRQALEIGLIENLQRQDLTPLEEAEGYRRLIEEFGHTQDEMAKTISKSRSHVTNFLRLLALPAEVRDLLEVGALTAGHARALLTTDDPVGLAHRVIRKGLNVRQTEKLASQHGAAHKKKPALRRVRAKDADIMALEEDLSRRLGLPVNIEMSSAGEAGRLILNWSSLDQLDALLHALTHGGQRDSLPNQ